MLGYGVIPMPVVPGSHDIECHLYRPLGDWIDQFKCMFVGGYPKLVDPAIIYSSQSRPDLATEPTETVYIHINVIERGVSESGIINGNLPDVLTK